MLYELHVKDMALIREARLEFGEGLHVLTGETGAGKSLLLGSVGLALGGKASNDIISAGAQSTHCELTFGVKDESVTRMLEDLGIEADEDGSLILSRVVGEKRSFCRLNGSSVTAGVLKDIATRLIDIHGQHEHQSLLKKANHIRILDEYAAEKMRSLAAGLKDAYGKYRQAVSELNGQKKDESVLLREKSLAEHEYNEIAGAHLKEGEDETLQDDFDLMSNGGRVMDALSRAAALIGAGSEMSSQKSAIDSIGEAVSLLSGVAGFDGRIDEMSKQLSQAEDIVADAAHSLSSYMDSFEFDEEKLAKISERLDLINSLKLRYGKTIEDVIAYGASCEKRLSQLEDYDAYMENLEHQVRLAKEELEKLCKKATELRRKAAKKLEEDMKRELQELNFPGVRFEVSISPLPEPSALGEDEVEFMISMNPGEPLKPLAKIASGGELSRIMLALRTVSAVKDGIETLIFDEIDTGISGITAGKVAKKLSDLSKGRQVICITHLPQIAAYGDHHYLIEKNVEEGDHTVTSIRSIEGDASVEELVRLLGGTASAAETARELKREADEYKKGAG